MNKGVPRYRVFGIKGDLLVEHPVLTLPLAFQKQEKLSNEAFRARVWDGKKQCFLEKRHEPG